MIEFSQSVTVAADILIREVDGETVLLNLEDEAYYGLDDVSTDFWQAITTNDTLQAAFDAIRGAYDVESDELTRDFAAFVTDLIDSGLLTTSR